MAAAVWLPLLAALPFALVGDATSLGTSVEPLESLGLEHDLPPSSSSSACPPNATTTQLLFRGLNLSYPGLAGVATAYQRNDTEAACVLLAAYYRSAPTAPWLRKARPVPTSRRAGGLVDAIVLNDTFAFYGDTARVPRLPDGSLNWSFVGPHDDAQWMLALNRHGYFASVLDAWLSTGNPLYAQHLDALSADWCRFSLPPPASASPPQWSPDWLTLDTGIRMGCWPTSFFGLQESPLFRNSTRLTMAAAVAMHASFLHRNPSSNTNWDATQSRGLLLAGVTFPELRNASAWRAFAVGRTARGLQQNVYPDGVSNEETAHYHIVALNGFDGVVQVLEEAHLPVAPEVEAAIVRMINYVALGMDQRGLGILNGDSDLDNNTALVLAAAARFGRPAWRYIATQGQSGTPPAERHAVFPWAGQVVMRSGYAAGDSWAWLDVGPFGSSGHAHRDKLHLSVRALGVHFLVDSGRFAYEGVLHRFLSEYGRLTQAHNVLMLDGHQQVAQPAIATAPLPNSSVALNASDAWASASISFDGLPGFGLHTRGVAFLTRPAVPDGVWVIVDRVTTDRPRNVTLWWHAHPDCTVACGGPGAAGALCRVAQNGTSNGLVIAAGGAAWAAARVVKGQETPSLQGWYSRVYGECAASPTLEYTATISGNATFAWVLFPSPDATANATARIVSEGPDEVSIGVALSVSRGTIYSATVSVGLRE